MKPRIAILISGGGSNMVSLVNSMKSNRINALPSIVISNNPNASGLKKLQTLMYQQYQLIIKYLMEIEKHLKRP